MKPALSLALVAALASPLPLPTQEDGAPAARTRAPAGEPLEQTFVLDAPRDYVWRCFTEPELMTAWMVDLAEVDLAIGGTLRTRYGAGELGDEETIVQEVLAYDPERMLATRVTKPPRSSPFADAMGGTWAVMYFEELPPESEGAEPRTRFTIRGLGYGDDEVSQRMRAFFEPANAWTIGRLRTHLAQR